MPVGKRDEHSEDTVLHNVCSNIALPHDDQGLPQVEGPCNMQTR
jgi:hypothetical protein